MLSQKWSQTLARTLLLPITPLQLHEAVTLSLSRHGERRRQQPEASVAAAVAVSLSLSLLALTAHSDK